MQPDLLSLQEIEGTKSLLPFNRTDVIVLTEWGRRIRREGRDFSFSKTASADRNTARWLKAGLVFLQSRSLDIEVLLIKAKDEERTNRRECLYLSFIGNYSANQWAQGATSGSLATGLRIIGNLSFPFKGDKSPNIASEVYGSTEPA